MSGVEKSLSLKVPVSLLLGEEGEWVSPTDIPARELVILFRKYAEMSKEALRLADNFVPLEAYHEKMRRPGEWRIVDYQAPLLKDTHVLFAMSYSDRFGYGWDDKIFYGAHLLITRKGEVALVTEKRLSDKFEILVHATIVNDFQLALMFDSCHGRFIDLMCALGEATSRSVLRRKEQLDRLITVEQSLLLFSRIFDHTTVLCPVCRGKMERMRPCPHCGCIE